MRKEQVTDDSSPHAQSRYRKGMYDTFNYKNTVNERPNELKKTVDKTPPQRKKTRLYSPFRIKNPVSPPYSITSVAPYSPTSLNMYCVNLN